jgi:hypothetical protein
MRTIERKFVLTKLQGKKMAKSGLRYVLGGYGDLGEVLIECSPFSAGEGKCFESVGYNACLTHDNPHNYCCWSGFPDDLCYFGK